MDREGRVLAARLGRSSGITDLDRKVVALPRRAQPPAHKAGETIEFVVPVEFFLSPGLSTAPGAR
ncbi:MULTISPECIES: energy transducer TonB [unclassified Sphingobium]|uniref:energy transducer TonB family protein n=1 Tax=unclassified Sphingobium TaxID=2611147 RepID=UPI0022249A2A|nr:MULTISPECIES: energy transducer TonB [unclassified Sphingobium]